MPPLVKGKAKATGGYGAGRKSDLVPGASGPRSELEAKRIWIRLGAKGNFGTVPIADIVKHSRYLEQTFPELLKKYAEVMVKGEVSWEAFKTLFVGASKKPLGKAKPKKPDDKGDDIRTLAELQSLFDTIDEKNTGHLDLADVIKHKDLVAAEMPELLAKWSEIDSDGSNTISWDEFRAFFGGTDDWLEFQLGEIVGLEDLKDQIRRFHRSVMLDEMRRKRGFAVDSGGGKYHMIFQGNPGTGKTSLGRLMAQLLQRVGIAEKDTLKEVQREQLVAGYIGQTAAKTQAEIEGAVGGLLFIDEAYRLSQGGEKDFGKEAIEQLMGAMNEPPNKAPIMVFAGYPADMDKFMSQNDGLFRRIPYTFDFPNYSCSELAEITEIMVSKKGYTLEDCLLENGRSRLAQIIERYTFPRARSLMNGGLCERIFTLGKQALDARDDPQNPSVELSMQDIKTACRQIPQPPASSDDVGGTAPDDGEVQQLRDTIRSLQSENGQLKSEVRRLKIENRKLCDTIGAGVASSGILPSGGRSSSAPTDQPRFKWEVSGGGDKWWDIPQEVSDKLSAARAAGQTVCSFSARGNDYEVDFRKMMQRNVATGTERAVRAIAA
eukprot:gnl/MRDRNA2_/MRDRNA2_36368_c0_seq1.p1 gnl/MRDRNA2_/MRDRNA2_36368_c0~~gnl/MRDRNA2_/MRDRNA2_36368_c0_seq1.p1  ORF type:complete len:605 (-),score=137.88 gnl/MRDRNA2_/MRDRNA2_36368_c0_seq1:255-2069(-)